MATFNFSGANITCHPSWDNFFNDSIVQGYLLRIQQQIGVNHTPQQPSDIFKVFQMDLNNCKVVILGQDPYPQQGVATGRAFEVGNITRWIDLKDNTSLQNILKLLHKNQVNTTGMVHIIDSVRKDITNGSFTILPPNRLFNNWESQGVLLLNTALTCEIGISGSHLIYWACFTQKVIDFIQIFNNINWFLWGKEAQEIKILITNLSHIIHESNHPRLHDNNPNSFYYKNNFSKVTSVNWY